MLYDLLAPFTTLLNLIKLRHEIKGKVFFFFTSLKEARQIIIYIYTDR